jgi:hypothetical protein
MAEHITSLKLPMLGGLPDLLLHGIGTNAYYPEGNSELIRSLFDGVST